VNLKNVPALNDPATGEPSVSFTILAITFGVAIIKILFAGLVIKGFVIPLFSASEFGMLLGVPSALYFGRKNSKGKKEEEV